MKVCLLSYRGNPYCGGQGIYISYLARELVRQGHEVHLVVGPPYPDEIDGVVVHRIPNHNYFNKKTNFINKHTPFDTLKPLNLYEFIASKFGAFPEIKAFSFRAFGKLKELNKIHRFDIIHDNQCLGYGYLLVKKLGIPFVSTIHHPITIDRSTWFESPSNFLVKMRRVLYYPITMQRIISNRMDRIVTVSHDSAHEIKKSFKVPADRISVIYNGIDTAFFKAVSGIKKKKNSIIFVGNIDDKKKGLEYLLYAIGKTDNMVNLTIVDGGAPCRRSTVRLIDRLGIGSMVRFTGKISVSKLIRLYSESEIAVSPSLYEGFGFPAAEAMACELPLIAAKSGALPEIVGEHMVNGYLVPTRDSNAIAEGIDFLLNNPDLRKRMGISARERICEKFSWRRTSHELVRIYEDVINANS